MPAPLHRPSQSLFPAPEDPQTLWRTVESARQALVEERHQPSGRSHQLARDQFLTALEAYATCLTNLHRPIPYALRDELRLLRLTCTADRGY